MTREQKRARERKLRHFAAITTVLLFMGVSASITICAMNEGDLSGLVVFFAVIGVATVTLLIMRFVLWLDGVRP